MLLLYFNTLVTKAKHGPNIGDIRKIWDMNPQKEKKVWNSCFMQIVNMESLASHINVLSLKLSQEGLKHGLVYGLFYCSKCTYA